MQFHRNVNCYVLYVTHFHIFYCCFQDVSKNDYNNSTYIMPNIIVRFNSRVVRDAVCGSAASYP